MVGTLARAFLKATSVMPLSALKPARINSLFLTPTPSVKARFFISPICSSSVFGMVKLSRTTLTFLSFNDLVGLVACLFTVGLVLGFGDTVLADLAGDFAGAVAGDLATGLAFLTAFGLTAGFTAGFTLDLTVGLTVGLAAGFTDADCVRWVFGAALVGAALAVTAVFLLAGAVALLVTGALAALAEGVAGADVAEGEFMVNEFLKLTVYTVYTVD
ncbi:MAG: hypothetical protein RLZZ329_1724 [Pseudomonadota bacterium]